MKKKKNLLKKILIWGLVIAFGVLPAITSIIMLLNN